MEIEFDPKNLKESLKYNAGGIVLIVLVLLFALGFLGKAFTPRSNTVLDWGEWQVIKVEKEYRTELSILQQDIEALSKIMQGQPDPVRGQIVSDQIITKNTKGLSALEIQRNALSNAARAVRQWAIGADTYDNAQVTLQNAVNLVAEAENKLAKQEAGQEGEKWR